MKSKEQLALEILDYSRNTLLVKLPFLSKVLFSLSFTESLDLSFAGDGETLYYNSDYIINQYKEDDQFLIRSYLHTLIHLLFYHNNIDESLDYPLWNLACDIAAEQVINQLDLDLNNPFLKQQQSVTDELSHQMPILNAENIYRHYRKLNLSKEECERIRFLFFKDEHGLWAKGDKEIRVKKWKEISKEVQTDLQTYHKDTNGILVQQLQQLNRRKMSLSYFLQRFGTVTEQLKLSQDEIDLQLYCYGKTLYEDILLIEPLEYRQEKKIHEMVIAIDTSGSVAGEPEKRFIETAYNIFSDERCLSRDMRLHIVQCDDCIREVKTIINRRELTDYLANIELKGFGQTDFRPVFEWVKNRISEKQIKNLKGLLYFTDGKGIFPLKKPSYPCGFVILQDRYHPVDVPCWAMKIELLQQEWEDEQFR